MDKDKRAFFTEVPASQSHKTFEGMKDRESAFRIWKKGTSAQEKFTLLTVSEDSQSLEFMSTLEFSNLPQDDLLLQFEAAGVHYFASPKGRLTELATGRYRIGKVGTLFKCERRFNFRLIVYPKIKSTLQVTIKNPPKTLPLFLVKGEKTTNFEFKVYDISVTGISFLIDAKWRGHFNPQDVFEGAILTFDEEEYPIPQLKVVYELETLHLVENNEKQWRVAVSYLGLNQKVEEKLFKQLNQKLRYNSLEGDFEEFLG